MGMAMGQQVGASGLAIRSGVKGGLCTCKEDVGE